MADITMCSNAQNGCKRRENCYRYMASPSVVQSWADFYIPMAKCENFFPIGRRKV